MPRFTTRKRVEHRAEQMFDLIADIERYPEFLPMCEALTIRSRREKGDRVLLIADMTVGYKMIRETFTSQVYLFREDLLIDVKYIDGPFKHLENRWRFFPIEQFPKSGNRFSDKRRGENKELEQTSDRQESHSALEGAAACEVDFYIDYEFKNKMLSMVMGSVFDMAFRRFVTAYEARANEIYGAPPTPSSVALS